MRPVSRFLLGASVALLTYSALSHTVGRHHFSHHRQHGHWGHHREHFPHSQPQGDFAPPPPPPPPCPYHR